MSSWRKNIYIELDSHVSKLIDWNQRTIHKLCMYLVQFCWRAISFHLYKRSDSSDHFYLNDILTLLWAKTFLGLEKYERTNRQYRWRCWNTPSIFLNFLFLSFLFEIRVVAEHTGVGFFGKLQAQWGLLSTSFGGNKRRAVFLIELQMPQRSDGKYTTCWAKKRRHKVPRHKYLQQGWAAGLLLYPV